MPGWQPSWDDVRFDHAAAADAVAELRAAARRIDDLADLRARAREQDLAGWVGPARVLWDQRFDATQLEAHDLAVRLRQEAGRIVAAGDAAQVEQRARERAREAWYRERAAERAAERERAARVPGNVR